MQSAEANKQLVGFGISYDVNMMLGDLSRAEVTSLVKGNTIEYEGFLLTYRTRKEFNVSNKGKRVTLWDVHGFFQSSFIKALQSYGIEVASIVTEGKQKRNQFTQDDITDMTNYCIRECIDLVKLCDKLDQYLHKAGLRITRYDGAGAAAAALLKKENIKKHYPVGIPLEWDEPCRRAYFGGRIECVRYGNSTSDITTLDINSAYPYAATQLPSMAGGEFIHHEQHGVLPQSVLTIVHIKWNYPFESMPFYPFPFRYRNAAIVFPHAGEGYYWLPEVQEALSHKEFASGITVLDTYEFIPETDERPFEFLNDLFRIRQEWKERGEGAEKALKLAINSVYGKTAQRVGYNLDSVHIPTYHNLSYAGFITSYTRSLLLRAAMIAPSRLISMQTDGVFIEGKVPTDGVSVGTGFGQFGIGIARGITIVQSGVYWLDTLLTKTIEHYRGFDANSLDRLAIIRAWKSNELNYYAPSTRFVTMTTAVGSDSEYKLWRKWITSERSLTLRMSDINCKRIDTDDNAHPHLGLISTYASPNMEFGNVSYPHVLPWSPLPQVDYKVVEEYEASL
jgi:hypothetical protein